MKRSNGSPKQRGERACLNYWERPLNFPVALSTQQQQLVDPYTWGNLSKHEIKIKTKRVSASQNN